MNLIRLTSENAIQYIGYDIIFKSRGNFIIKKIIDICDKSIKIDHPDLGNHLVFNRKIHVIIAVAQAQAQAHPAVAVAVTAEPCPVVVSGQFVDAVNPDQAVPSAPPLPKLGSAM